MLITYTCVVWMYFDSGFQEENLQWHDIRLSLFLWFMCKIKIFLNHSQLVDEHKL
jgi:hypothetical protein